MAISLRAGVGVAVVASLSRRYVARSARFSDMVSSTVRLQECQRRAKSTYRESARAITLSACNCPMAETTRIGAVLALPRSKRTWRGLHTRARTSISLRERWRRQFRSTRPTPLHFLDRSEEHTSELQSLMRISYAVFCLKKKTQYIKTAPISSTHNTI